jgi:hypothetical protein
MSAAGESGPCIVIATHVREGQRIVELETMNKRLKALKAKSASEVTSHGMQSVGSRCHCVETPARAAPNHLEHYSEG